MEDDVVSQFISPEKKAEMEKEYQDLKFNKLLAIAKRIDDARQLGDLSENAEYHAAREEMAWTQSRIAQISAILESAEVTSSSSHSNGGRISVGSSIVVESKGKKREYTIVGGQEADPLKGKISNESPIGQAFLGKKKGDTVTVEIPAGVQIFTVLEVK